MWKATCELLYGSKKYQPGEVLPADDKEMLEAWKRSGAAVEVKESTKKGKAKKDEL